MNALVFLMTRRLLNSFKRAFRNPGRTVGTLAVVAFFLIAYGGPFFLQSHDQPKPTVFLRYLPPLDLVFSIFTLMVCGYLFFTFMVSVDYTRAFTEHDVVNVFPTPLPRKLVFQFFLFTRGLLASALSILILAYLFFRTSRALITVIPQSGSAGTAFAGPFIFAVLFIAANCALLIGGVLCGLALFQKRISKKFLWVIIVSVPAVFLAGLLYRTISGMVPARLFLGEILQRSIEQPFATLLLPFRAIAASALLAYAGWTYEIPAGMIIWGGLFVLFRKSLMKLSPRLYEYAGRIAEVNSHRKEQLKNQSFGITSLGIGSAADEKKSAGRWRWQDAWTPTGAMALFWRNLVMMQRSNIMLVIKVNFVLSTLLYGGIAALRLLKPGMQEAGLLALGGTVQFFVIFLFVTAAIGWLTGILKRFEIQKPLPIPPRRAIFAELLPIAAIVTCTLIVGLLFLVALFPHKIGVLLLGTVAISSSYLLMSCLLFMVLLFNPDQYDTLQRMLFGIFTLLIIVLGLLPSSVVVGLGAVFHFPWIVQVMIVLPVNGVCIYAVIVLAAKKYESFNPAE